MIRVPRHSPAPTVLRTLADYRSARVELVSHCGSGCGHSRPLDLDALIADHGAGTEVDYAFKVSLRCPACGGPGGGLEVRVREP